MDNVRRAKEKDLPFLCKLEKESFKKEIRSSTLSIKNSLKSDHQRVFIVDENNESVASATVFLFKNSLRLYSIAVLKEKRKQGYGSLLINYIISYAEHRYFEYITLEADILNKSLIKFYESFGFKKTTLLKDYYGEGFDGIRMTLKLMDESKVETNIVITDKNEEWLSLIPNITVVSAKDYITKEKYQKERKVRVFNLCSSYSYQSMGYYVSLLASARKQRIIPNVATIQDFTDSIITESIADDLYDEMQRRLGKIDESEFTLDVYFGYCLDKKFETLANGLYRLFECPFIRFVFTKSKDWTLNSASPIALEDIEMNDKIVEFAKAYFEKKEYPISRFKDYKYNLAILIDPEELTPPSCKVALRHFMHEAEKIGFYTEFITKEDYSRLTEFDALFIRATTNVNNYTYKFSRYAYAEGLAVIDDPWSILKCANKIYLAEVMKKENVKTPKTILVEKGMDYRKIADDLSFPIVLKVPDSAYCLGVFKVEDMNGLKDALAKMFSESEIVLAQEFMKSDFDWRIGVLDNKPLYACRYYMAEGHWQISKWNKNQSSCLYGKYDTLPVEDAPKEVVKSALKAAAAMGDGLYGVDLKEVDNQVYVIEVNDNPSIDYRVEDRVLKSEIYKRIMTSLYKRCESGNKKRYVSNEYRSSENN